MRRGHGSKESRTIFLPCVGRHPFPAPATLHPPPEGDVVYPLTITMVVLLAGESPQARPLLLKPARVFDGVALKPHADWVVLVRGDRIQAAGPASEVQSPGDARVIELPGTTLLPGLIEGHSHLFLHPY